MKKSHAYLSVLMAGMLAGAGVYAQTTPAAGSSEGPPKAGAASNQTMGVPNAKTTNSPAGEAPAASSNQPVTETPLANKEDTHQLGAPAGSAVASPTTMGPHALSRAEVRNDLLSRRARFQELRHQMRG
jgi:hypothetical protein